MPKQRCRYDEPARRRADASTLYWRHGQRAKVTEKLRYLEDRWDESVAYKLDAAELLRYRSNLLGSDLRITNFGGGNTSSKFAEADPIDRSNKSVLWIKGSGGDIGSIQRT